MILEAEPNKVVLQHRMESDDNPLADVDTDTRSPFAVVISINAGERSNAKVGDTVVIGQYGGQEIELGDGDKVLIMNIGEINAVVKD